MSNENNEEVNQNLEENALEANIVEENITEEILTEENEIENTNEKKQIIIKFPEMESLKRYPLIVWGILIITFCCGYLVKSNELNNFIAMTILGISVIIIGLIVLLIEKINENAKIQKENDNREKEMILESILDISDEKLRLEIVKELIISGNEKK